ncbi:MAG TPA: phosphatidylglycerol lysyltransferase domain-containing protein [Acidimicrobiales bacterium]|nr:phosphatidylglycerol lysyltransferase domain-containing protein [Acidimicrobiales bacterium]
MADDLVISLPVGARVLVVANLLLGNSPSPASLAASEELAHAVSSWTGPGAVVVAGNLFSEQGVGSPIEALSSHVALKNALASFSKGAARSLVVLPGERDGWLRSSPGVADALRKDAGAQIAGAVTAEFGTRSGASFVRIEVGQYPGSGTIEAVSPGYGRLADLVPGIWRGSTSAWLAGMEKLEDPAAVSRFVASRLVYRQFGRRAWLLVIPVLVALAIALARPARHFVGAFLATAAIAGAVEVLVLLTLAAVSVRQIWLAFSAQSARPRDINEPGRAMARQLVGEGFAGMVTGGTGRPELVRLGSGFYANPGCCAEVVTEYPSRLAGAGLPSPFLACSRSGWVELEAGNELHARLLCSEAPLGGATFLERLLAKGLSRAATFARRSHRSPTPALIASLPHGQEWPREASYPPPERRTRRIAALVVTAAGLVSLLAAVAGPVAHRLRAISRLMPLAVPQAAGALAALGGIALIMLALGIRRGQRRAYVVCEATLLAVAAAHFVRAATFVPALVALAVAIFLWSRRQFFRAASDVPPLRRALALFALAGCTAILAGTVTLEGDSWVDVSLRHHQLSTLGWGQAFLATVERMIAVQHVALPPRLNGFFTPTMFSTSAGLVLAAGWVVFRPVATRRRASADAMQHARAIVARYGGGTLDYFALRADKEFYFSGETLVAYAVYGGVCLVSPDPVGPLAQREQAWRSFRAHVDSNGWSLAVLGAGEDWLPIYHATGMHDLYVGDEAVVRVRGFSLEGGKFKGLRQAVNRVARYGYTISFHDPAKVDLELAAQLREVMTRSRRGGVERGFSMTLGRVFDASDQGLLLAVVHAPTAKGASAPGQPVAFCQYVPAPSIRGFSLDLMRRDNGEHPNGLIDFAVVETIRYLAAGGYEGLGLNFSTMRAVLAGEAGDGMAQRVQVWLLKRMSGSMQIESLWRFNAKFEPDWQPRYAVYDSPEHALPAALAVARAESFWELPLIGRFLVPGSQRGPAPDIPDGGAHTRTEPV